MRCLEAYGVVVGVPASDGIDDRVLAGLCRTLPIWRVTDAAPTHRLGLHAAPGDRLEVRLDRETIGVTDQADVVAMLAGELEFLLMTDAPDHVVIHAGAVHWLGHTLLLPGPSHCGKSTLVEHLVRRGATYFSDELAPIDPTGRLHPYPRPLGLRGPAGGASRPLSVASLGATVATAPGPVDWVLVATYRSGPHDSAGALRDATAAEAVVELLRNTAQARLRPARVLKTLSVLCRGARASIVEREDAKSFADRLEELLTR